MRKTAALIGLLLLLSTVSYASAATTQLDPSKIHFYMYGLATCPHCHHMRAAIPKAYGNSSLTYYELLNNDQNRALFNEQLKYTDITGVPAIAITYNGTLYAVIEGEFNVSAVPQIIEQAMKANGVLLFNGKWYLFPRNDTKAQVAIKALYTIFVQHRMPNSNGTVSSTSTTSTPTTSSTTSSTSTSSTSATKTPVTSPTSSSSSSGKGICGPAFIVALAAIPLVLRKRR